MKCPNCVERVRRGVQKRVCNSIDLNDRRLEEVEQFCFLGNVMDCDADLERTVRVIRVSTTCKKWREKVLSNFEHGQTTLPSSEERAGINEQDRGNFEEYLLEC